MYGTVHARREWLGGRHAGGGAAAGGSSLAAYARLDGGASLAACVRLDGGASLAACVRLVGGASSSSPTSLSAQSSRKKNIVDVKQSVRPMPARNTLRKSRRSQRLPCTTKSTIETMGPAALATWESVTSTM